MATVSDVNVCAPCPEGMLECKVDEIGIVTAVSCGTNSKLVNGACVIICWDGLYYAGEPLNRCIQCPDNCKVCKDGLTCEQCGLGYTKNDTTGACDADQKLQCPLYGFLNPETNECNCQEPYVWNSDMTACTVSDNSNGRLRR